MNRKIIIGSSVAAVVLAAGVGIAVAGSGGGATPGGNGPAASSAAASSKAATIPAGEVGVKANKLGQILVDARGRTLYLFEKDTGPASTCYSACAAIWPPLTVSAAPQAGPGLVASKLGTTTRTGGQTQVTYNDHPLYYYAADTASGQTQGQGLDQFGASWFVVAPSGTKVANSA